MQMIDIVENMKPGDFEYLKTVSKELNMGIGKIGRLFYSGTGDTMRGYVSSRIASKAVKLLVETDYSVADISIMVGYKSTKPALAQRLKATYGMGPLQLRKTVKPSDIGEWLFPRLTAKEVMAELEADAPAVVVMEKKTKELPGW